MNMGQTNRMKPSEAKRRMEVERRRHARMLAARDTLISVNPDRAMAAHLAECLAMHASEIASLEMVAEGYHARRMG